MNDPTDIQKIKMQLSLQSAAIHALCAALDSRTSAAAYDIFQAAAEVAYANLLATSIDEPTRRFFEEMRASLGGALQHPRD